MTAHNRSNMEDLNNLVRLNDISSCRNSTGNCQVSIGAHLTESFVVFKFYFPDLNGAMDVVVSRGSELSKGDPVSLQSQVDTSLYTHCMQELFAREKAPEIRELVLKQMGEEAPDPNEWWRVLVEVREAEKKRKIARPEGPLKDAARTDGSTQEELKLVEPTKKKRSKSKKKKSRVKETTKTTTALEKAEEFEGIGAGESSKRITSDADLSPFTFAFEDDSKSRCLVMEGRETLKNTMTASTVNAVSNPQPGGKRHRKGSKSMAQIGANEALNPDSSRDVAIERLKAEALPVSLEVALERRRTLRRERTGTIQFLRECTLSRGSSVLGSRPASPPYRGTAPDIDIARLDKVTETDGPLTPKSAIPEANRTPSASAQKETCSAREKEWQTAMQQRMRKPQSDLLAAKRSGSVRIKPSRTEKQSKVDAKSSRRDRATIDVGESETSSKSTTQAEKLDQVFSPPNLAAVSPNTNLRLSYVFPVHKADETLSQQRLQKADIITTLSTSKESQHPSHVTVRSQSSKSSTTRHGKANIAGGCLSPQPLQKVESTRIFELREPNKQRHITAALPHPSLEVSQDATTDVPEEKAPPSGLQTSGFTAAVTGLKQARDQNYRTAIPSRSDLGKSKHSTTGSEENNPSQSLQSLESITHFRISDLSEHQTDVKTGLLNPDINVSHHVVADTADEHTSLNQDLKSEIIADEDMRGSMHQERNNGESAVPTEPCHWPSGEGKTSRDGTRLDKAIAAWQDYSDDEVEITTNQQVSLRDPLPYSVNNEAYFFHDRPFVVPPQFENEENMQNGICFPEIPPLLGDPYTGHIPDQVPLIPPLICRCKLHGESQALINYDPSIHRVIIHPSPHHLPDLRNDPYHPDWLPSIKLAEYQAYEQAGYPVYRFDRVTFECALSSCRQVLKDHVRSTHLCNGCGPYTDVRYCSKEHLFKDCQTHWKICGRVPPRIVWDEWTMPSRYRRRYPAIKDIRGRNSPERQRQQAYSIHHRASDYVIFSDRKDKQETGQERRGTGKPIVFLIFKDGDPMKDTFNRLLNIAFFGTSLMSTLHHPQTPFSPKTPFPRRRRRRALH